MKIEFKAEAWKQAFRIGTVVAFWLVVIAFILAKTYWLGAHDMAHYMLFN